MRPNPHETLDLVTFTEEIRNGKLFLCIVGTLQCFDLRRIRLKQSRTWYQAKQTLWVRKLNLLSEKIRKSHENLKIECLMLSSTFKIKILVKRSRIMPWKRNQSFLDLPNFAWFSYFFPNILRMIILRSLFS